MPGTTILVEDLFYNVPTRKKVLKSTTEEYGRILDIVGRYAVHCTGCGFTVKRAGEARSDLHTLPQVCTVAWCDVPQHLYAGNDAGRDTCGAWQHHHQGAAATAVRAWPGTIRGGADRHRHLLFSGDGACNVPTDRPHCR